VHVAAGEKAGEAWRGEEATADGGATMKFTLNLNKKEFNMSKTVSKFAFVAGVVLAMVFTFSCSSDDDGGSGDDPVIEALQPPVIVETTLPNGEKSVYYYAVVAAIHNNITFSLVVESDSIMVAESNSVMEGESVYNNITLSLESGELPQGLQFEDESEGLGRGRIFGTPTQVGTYTFTVKAENEAGNNTKEFTIVIGELQPPIITETMLPNGGKDSSYSMGIAADGSNITLSLENGELPPGLELGGNYIQGTPTQVGTYTFTVKAENEAGNDTKEFTIEIREHGLPVESPIIPKLSIIPSPFMAMILKDRIVLKTINNATVEIYSIEGNLISLQNFTSGVHTIQLLGLPKGMYIVKVSFV